MDGWKDGWTHTHMMFVVGGPLRACCWGPACLLPGSCPVGAAVGCAMMVQSSRRDRGQVQCVQSCIAL